MKIPFLNLSSQTEVVLDDFLSRIQDIAHKNQFIGGAPVQEFEQKFAVYCGVKNCVALNSGTDGLRLALVASGIDSNDEVITSPFTFVATTEVISQTGKLVLADIDLDTFNLSVEAIRSKVSDRTRAVLPVHIFGLPASMLSILEFSQKYNLTVIEDACQAHGAAIGEKKVGSFGQLASFSFYPTKNLGAFGDGGAVTSDDELMAERIRRLRNHGEVEGKYQHQEEGYNSRMDALQAVVLNLKLSFLEDWVNTRRQLASLYKDRLGHLEEIQFQKEPDNYRHSYHLLAARVKRRSELVDHLTRSGIETKIIYPIPIHLLPAYHHLNYRCGDFPNAEKLCKQILSFPLYPGMTESQILQVSDVIEKFYVG